MISCSSQIVEPQGFHPFTLIILTDTGSSGSDCGHEWPAVNSVGVKQAQLAFVPTTLPITSIERDEEAQREHVAGFLKATLILHWHKGSKGLKCKFL